MLKKCKFLFLVLLCAIIGIYISTCFIMNDGVFWYMYFGWKEVEIDKAGTIKIPNDWLMNYDDENQLYYFVDENNEPKMVETYLHIYHEESVEKGMFGNEEIIDYFGEITKIKQNGGTNLENGAFYGEAEYVSNHQTKNGFILKVAYSYLSKTFVIVDNRLSNHQIFKIAHSSKP